MYYIVLLKVKSMSVTTVRLQAEVEQQLDAIANRLNRSKGWVINQALAEYIDKQAVGAQLGWQQTLELPYGICSAGEKWWTPVKCTTG